MGYIFLTFALIGGLAKGFAGKKVSNDMETLTDCLFINIMRAVFCAIIGFIALTISQPQSIHFPTSEEMRIYIISAIGMSAFCICWMYAYKSEAYMFLSIFTMIGSIITCTMDFFIYHEAIKSTQWIGMFVILLAVYIMSKYNKGLKGSLTLKGLAILIVGCIGSATTDFSQKMIMRETAGNAITFNFYTYFISFIIMFVIYLLLRRNNAEKVTPVLKSRMLVTIYFTMAAALYVNTTCKTFAANFLSAAQIYPVIQGANLICSAILAQILLKEKITLKSCIGMSCAFAGLLIMNLL